MARPEQVFDAHNLESVLLACVQPRRAQRIVILLDGPIRALIEQVRVRALPERGVQIRAGTREGARALGLAFLALGGRIETGSDPSAQQQPGSWVPLSSILSQARVWADSIKDLLGPLGGLGATPSLDKARLQAHALPDMADRVARLADGKRSIVQVFEAAGNDELLVARILNRLFVEGLLTVPVSRTEDDDPLLPAPRPPPSHFDMPERGWGHTSAMPETDLNEFEGQAVRTDIRHWLHTEAPPDSWQSEAAFKHAFSGDLEPQDEASAPTERPEPSNVGNSGPESEKPSVAAPVAEAGPVSVPVAPEVAQTPAPVSHLRVAPPPPDSAGKEAVGRVRQAVPFTTGRPQASEDEALLQEAGVGAGGVSPLVWVLAVAAIIVVIIVVRGGCNEPPPATIVAPPVATASVATTTVSTATVAIAPADDGPAADGLRPTVAAADAPEVVRRAESLIEAERFREAGRLLKRLRTTRPQDPAVLILSGMVFVDTNRLRAAHTMAEQALALDARSFRAWVLKGSVLQFQGKNTRALAAYARALELGPDHPMSDQVRAVMGSLKP